MKNFLRLAAVLPLAAAAVPAAALTSISQTVSIPSVIAPVPAIIEFDRFDSALGALQSVELSFESFSTSTLALFNTRSSTRNATIDPFGSALLAGHGFSLLAFDNPASYQISLSAYELAFETINMSFEQSGLLTSGLGDFIGGGDVGFLFAPFANVFWTGAVGTPPITWFSGNATITYNYEQLVSGTVPEPATWAMLIAGFGLVGVAMRRRPAIGRVTA